MVRTDETTYNAGETTIGEMADRLGLDERDRICYLYDYGDEWRFYTILKEVDDDGAADEAPHVVDERGEALEQYGSDR
ncbi:IS1096 element passenger TnpR family protein [Halorubrum sp. AS12]|uniref:IS1096 element passenger TnpR family protein n=1 Tax=Halorubrum sp. AS12 TaxID=3409687 RepID=UPI003DA71F4E